MIRAPRPSLCSAIGLACVALATACTSGGTFDGPDGTGGTQTTSSTTTSNTTSSATTSSATGGSGGEGCPAPPACDAPPPAPGVAQPWNDSLGATIAKAQGAPTHRMRDLFLGPGDPQWVLAKFAYGALDYDLAGEWVDIYLLRDCGTQWALLGSALTTHDGDHATVEGVDDTGGRVFFQIPAAAALGPGRHRVHLVVRGDLTTADGAIEIVAPGTPIFVSDIDGTLTTYETEAFVTLLTGTLPGSNPNSPEALQLLAERGIRPFYLTARPEWLERRTHEFLAAYGYPPGIVHTTLSFTGALGGSAETYKTAELSVITDRGLVFRYAFGNTASDGAAYDNAAITPIDHRIFFQYDDTLGGRRIEDYGELLSEFAAVPPACP